EHAPRETERKRCALEEEDEGDQHRDAHEAAALERAAPRGLGREPDRPALRVADLLLLLLRLRRCALLGRAQLGERDLVALLVDLEDADVVAEVLLAATTLFPGGHSLRLPPVSHRAVADHAVDDVASE